ncbi:predicted protein [Arabidopsis lyrata subsp. lyrata]|uniref:Predicted protein n=1 Tax=Arabidopsis lyrata subsp. lyrata TaxID=81972 RepID=D7MW11_ARALL|nr:predicted protein [Arabidopsis lyrata subsp. lyrata]
MVGSVSILGLHIDSRCHFDSRSQGLLSSSQRRNCPCDDDMVHLRCFSGYAGSVSNSYQWGFNANLRPSTHMESRNLIGDTCREELANDVFGLRCMIRLEYTGTKLYFIMRTMTPIQNNWYRIVRVSKLIPGATCFCWETDTDYYTNTEKEEESNVLLVQPHDEAASEKLFHTSCSQGVDNITT